MFKLKSKKLITLISFSLALIICSCSSNVASTSPVYPIHELEQNSQPEKGDSFRLVFRSEKSYDEPVYMTTFDEDQKKEADNMVSKILDSIKNNDYKTYSSFECGYKVNRFLEKEYFNYLRDMFNDSDIELLSTMHFDDNVDGTSFSSEYGQFFYSSNLRCGVESYNYLYTVKKENVTHTFTISIGSDIDGNLLLIRLVDGYIEIDSKNFEDWQKESVVLCQQERYIPAMMRLRMAIKTIPSDDYLKPKYGSMTWDLQQYINEKVDSPIHVTTPEDKFEVIYIKPEYWRNSQNFGYAIYYNSKFESFASQKEKIQEEARRLHDEMISRGLLDSVGHYTYVPQFSDEKPKEVYDQRQSIIFESSDNSTPESYINSYVNFGQAFEPISRSSELFADVNLESYICSQLEKTPENLVLDDLKNIKHLDLEDAPSKIYSLKGISKLSNLEYLDIGYSDLYSLDEIGMLTKLKHLDISYTSNIDDLSALKNLTNLEYLDISKSDIDSIEAVSSLKNLRTFRFLSINDIDISAIANLSKLEHIAISGSNENLKTLEKISENIKTLDFSGLNFNKINFPNLESLTSYGVGFSGPLMFENPSLLKTLKLDHASKLDFDFIDDLDNLESLTLSSCDLENIDFLKKHTNLVHLDVSSNDLVNLNGLENFRKLEYLDVSMNDLTELNIVKNLNTLKYLNLKSNYEINDVSPLESLDDAVEVIMP